MNDLGQIGQGHHAIAMGGKIAAKPRDSGRLPALAQGSAPFARTITCSQGSGGVRKESYIRCGRTAARAGWAAEDPGAGYGIDEISTRIPRQNLFHACVGLRSGCRMLDMPQSSTQRSARCYPYLAGELFSSRRQLRLSLETSRLAQGLRFVGGFPGEVLIGTPEVTISRGLAIDRTAQIEALDNALRRQLESWRAPASAGLPSPPPRCQTFPPAR